MKMVVFYILQRISLKDQVYDYLKKAIMNGELASGEIYSEQYFATNLNISRTPVREAILQLKQENLLEIYPSRGVMIKPMSFEELKKILQVRIAIEGYSAMYLARNIHKEDAQELLSNLEEYLNLEKDVKNRKEKAFEFMRADVDFHFGIINYTNNEYFVTTIQTLRSRIERVIFKSLQKDFRMGDAVSEHQELFECIKRGDEHGAFASFQQHMQNTEELLSTINFD